MRYIFLIIIIVASMSVCADDLPQSVVSQLGGVEFVASLNKSVYMDGEPIILTLSLANTTDKPLLIMDLMNGSYCGTTVKMIVTPTPKPNFKSTSYFSYAEGLWEFQPGEKHTIEVDLQRQYRYNLEIGDYNVSAKYIGPDLIRGGVVNQAIALDCLKFSVVKGFDTDAGNARLFKQVWRNIHTDLNMEDTLDVLNQLSNPQNKGDLSGYAKFVSALVSGNIGDIDGMISKYRSFLIQHSDLPCYGQLAVQKLAIALIEKKHDYTGAKDVLSKMDNGCVRRKLTNICDRRIALSKSFRK